MADKSFGVTQLDILGSGEPTISAPDRLKLDSHNVAISTSLHVGAATTIGGDLNVSGVSTFSAGGFVDIRRNVSITGIATIAAPYNTNAQVAWTVTNNSASAYRFTGPGQSGSDDNPDLYLVRGQRYIFKHEATSSHPLEIRVANGGAAYNDGVTNNGQHSTNITFNVQHDAPAQLFYQCTSHGGMVGNIYIVGGPQVISGVVTATTFVGNLTGNVTGTASANAVLTGSTNNTIVTVTGANAIQGEANLTFDGAELAVSGTGIRVDRNGGNPYIDFRSSSTSEAYIYGGTSGLQLFTKPSGGSIAERLRITSGGALNVPAGIGPQLRFENQHSVTTDAVISTFDDAAGTLLCLGSNYYFNSSGAETRYNTSEESAGILINRNGQINLSTGGTGATAIGRLSIYSNGDVEVKTGSLIIGTAGEGIDFAATSDATGKSNERLEDYEEGTWTPAYSSVGGTYGYTTQNGYYTKVGDVVTVSAYIRTSSVSATQHNLVKVTGLPFAEGKSQRTPGSVRCNGFQGTLSNMNFPVTWSVEAGQTFGELQRFVDGGNTDFSSSTMNNATFVYLQCTYMVS